MNPPLSIIKDKHLHELTTFAIGGPARYFYEAHSIEEMQQLMKHCFQEKLRYMVLGKGSNTLFDDRGFDGLIILNKIDFLDKPREGVFHAGAGYSFSLLGSQTARHGWSGLEFASGIPGSVGGAVWMNAGANGSETAKALASVDFVNERGELRVYDRSELEFAYRHSPFQKMSGAIVGATFTLMQHPEARQKQIEIINRRKMTQPLKDKSAGCIFRNPDCGHAGELIERSQLKGVSIGGAKVSEIHANFIVNTGEGSSQDVKKLLELVKKQVKETTGVELQSEVCFIPYSLEEK